VPARERVKRFKSELKENRSITLRVELPLMSVLGFFASAGKQIGERNAGMTHANVGGATVGRALK